MSVGCEKGMFDVYIYHCEIATRNTPSDVISAIRTFSTVSRSDKEADYVYITSFGRKPLTVEKLCSAH